MGYWSGVSKVRTKARMASISSICNSISATNAGRDAERSSVTPFMFTNAGCGGSV